MRVVVIPDSLHLRSSAFIGGSILVFRGVLGGSIIILVFLRVHCVLRGERMCFYYSCHSWRSWRLGG
jgi:hypothetical protein